MSISNAIYHIKDLQQTLDQAAEIYYRPVDATSNQLPDAVKNACCELFDYAVHSTDLEAARIARTSLERFFEKGAHNLDSYTINSLLLDLERQSGWEKTTRLPRLPIIRKAETGFRHTLTMLWDGRQKPKFIAGCWITDESGPHSLGDTIARWGHEKRNINRRAVMLPAMFELMMRYETDFCGRRNKPMQSYIAQGARSLKSRYPKSFVVTDEVMDGELSRRLENYPYIRFTDDDAANKAQWRTLDEYLDGIKPKLPFRGRSKALPHLDTFESKLTCLKLGEAA